MMAYTIFVSHTRQDKKIAEQIKKIINDAFSGHIQLYLAAHELSPGTAWKDEIKRRLDSCDAIFSVISPRSLHKPWIYIEWTAFWLNDKRSYILLTENVQVADLVSPMADLQTVSVSSVEDINSLFRSLARVSDFQGAIPFDYADEFITGIRAAQRTVLQTLLEQSYGRYEYELTDLPSDNDEKQKIAEYFLESGNYETFYKVVEEITAESVKVKLVRKLIEAADILHATNVVRTINASIQLKAVGKCLFDFGYADTP
ncbi:MAG: toll/interleukin-1 receptor domain-containing protein, partial [Chloroflexota bacterium]